MRLKKLYIENYKNLKDFTADFESGNGLSILIGNNGSGKSNFLEIISGIFHDLFKEKTGRKGIGFKSVFSLARISAADNVVVHICSNGFSFKLDHQVGAVIPIWEDRKMLYSDG